MTESETYRGLTVQRALRYRQLTAETLQLSKDSRDGVMREAYLRLSLDWAGIATALEKALDGTAKPPAPRDVAKGRGQPS
jgi:hypothetical protein